MKSETIQIDKAGRIVLPKAMREQSNLVAGDKLRILVEGTGIRLEPASPTGNLVRKGTALVFTGEFVEPIMAEKVEQLIANQREGRLTARAGKLHKG